MTDPINGGVPTPQPTVPTPTPAIPPVGKDPVNPYIAMGITDTNDHQYLQNKGNPDFAKLFEFYKGLEKKMGSQDRLALIPNDHSSDAEIKDYKTKMGIPEDYKKYKDFENNTSSEKDEMFKFFQESNFSESQVNKILNRINQGRSKKKTVFDQNEAKDIATLTVEWGDEYGTKVSKVNAVSKELGMSDVDLLALRKSLGTEKTYKLLNNIAMRSSEDTYVSPVTGSVSESDHSRFTYLTNKMGSEGFDSTSPEYKEYMSLQEKIYS
ncbi:MAG: hypothetical protein ACTSP4_00690 [Candidatus Hodarchaeales archaeon]